MKKELSDGTKDEQRTAAESCTSASLVQNGLLPAVADLKCCQCGNELDDEEMEAPYKDQWDEIICDNCYRESYQFDCPICEDYHDKTDKPEETFFYLHEQNGNLKPGYYRVKDLPVFISDMFSVSICEDAVELVSDNICYKYDGKLERTEFICEACFNEKGLSKNRIENHIRLEANKVYKPRKYKNYKKVIVSVSPEYFEIMGGKIRFKNARLKMDKNKKVQQLSVHYEL